MAIITAATYKTFKGISASTWDAQLAVIVPQAIDDFQTYTGRTLATATFTEKHDGNDQQSITLFNTPVSSITSVTLTTPQGSSSTISTSAFAIDLNSGVLKFDPPGNRIGTGVFPDDSLGVYRNVWEQAPIFPKGHQNITVVYVAGYAEGTYPAGMQAALYQYIDILLAQALLQPGQVAFKKERLGLYDYELANNGSGSGNSSDPLASNDPLVRLFFRFKRLGGGQ